MGYLPLVISSWVERASTRMYCTDMTVSEGGLRTFPERVLIPTDAWLSLRGGGWHEEVDEDGSPRRLEGMHVKEGGGQLGSSGWPSWGWGPR